MSILRPDEIDEFEREVNAYDCGTKWLRLFQRSLDEDGLEGTTERIGDIVSQLTKDERDAIIPPRVQTAGFDPLELFLSKNPQLLIPLGFDELRVVPNTGSRYLDALEQAIRDQVGAGVEHYRYSGQDRVLWDFHFGLRCRELSTGLWYSYGGLHRSELAVGFRAADGSRRVTPLREMIQACRRVFSHGDFPAALILPNLWTPPEVSRRIELADTTKAIIEALGAEGCAFERITWVQLEEIVAELLRSRGLAVSVTPRSADGGRDIIAKGELIPGEPSILAVEVKHRAVVKVDDIRSRIYANRQFPAVMFVTSGRFSAGVIREKKQPENFMRLLLKDGVALKSWIGEYSRTDRRSTDPGR